MAGAVKVTVAPETGLLNWSTSWTTSGLANAVLTVALWGLPETMVKVSPVVLACDQSTFAVPQLRCRSWP